MIAENEDLLTEHKPVHVSTAASIFRTSLSLALFIAVDYWIFKSWSAVCLLVSVIFIHESGHFIAMKIFGYKGIKMTFVPFLGAYVSGKATHYSKYKKIIMLLAGPVPGILIGMMLLFLYQQNFNNYFYLAALAFLFLNLFNLLPVNPLDGGQIIETLFFSGNQIIQTIFLYISLLIVLYSLFAFQSWFLVIIVWLIFIRIRSIQLTYHVRKELDKNNFPYNCSYEDLTDDQYAQIRDVLVTQSSLLSKRFTPGVPSNREEELISYIEKILMPAYHQDLTMPQKLFFISLYFLAFILPLIQWGLLKNWF